MHAPKFLRTLKRRAKRYIHRYGYNPLRAIARECEKRRFIHIGMRVQRRRMPPSVQTQQPRFARVTLGRHADAMTLPAKLAVMRARMHANERRFRQALTNDKANTQHLPAVQVAQARVLQQQPRFRPTDMEAMRGATHSGAFASDRADAWINEPGVDETKRRLRSVRLEAMR